MTLELAEHLHDAGFPHFKKPNAFITLKDGWQSPTLEELIEAWR
jgi:hypothetical protein